MATKKKQVAKIATKVMPEGIVNTAVLNVRKEPSQQAQIVRQIVEGTQLDIVAIDGEWIELEDGYVMAKFVR